MSTRLIEGPESDGLTTGDTDADEAYAQLRTMADDWADDIRTERIDVNAIGEYLGGEQENELTSSWRFPDGSVLRFQVGRTEEDPTRVLVIEAASEESTPEAERRKPCLIGWHPARLPDGTWGSRHDAAALLPQQLLGRRIVVEARKNRKWTSEILEVVERTDEAVLVRDGKPYQGVSEEDRERTTDSGTPTKLPD